MFRMILVASLMLLPTTLFAQNCVSCSPYCQQIIPRPAASSTGALEAATTTCRTIIPTEAYAGLYYSVEASEATVVNVAKTNLVAASVLASFRYGGEPEIDPIDRRSGVIYFSSIPTADSIQQLLKGNWSEAGRLSRSLPTGKKLQSLYRTELYKDGSVAGIMIETTGDAIINPPTMFIPLRPSSRRALKVASIGSEGNILEVGQ